MDGLTGKVVVVTGAGSGIGAATVTRLRSAGAVTVGWDLAAPDAPPPHGAAAVDVTDDDAVRAATDHVVAEHGRIDGLVNCAGVLGASEKIAETPLDTARRTFAVNTHAVLATMQAAIPHMVEAGGGAIVNVASNAAVRGRPGLAPYGASKSAALFYTVTAAREYGRHGVRVNAVCPGATATPMVGDAVPEQVERVTRSIPLGRMATPDEIAAPIVFLLSDEAAYVSGATLVVDGADTA